MDAVVQPIVLSIANQLKEFFLTDPLSSKEFSIFLCGGSTPEQEKFRREVGDIISLTRSQYRYRVYYPEEMFVELILGHGKKDLLSLENMLAESSHAVAILVHSPGTIAELGAFANHPELKDKLILVVDIKHRKSKSFINLGPIRHLQKRSKSKVIWLPMNTSNIKNICKVITESCRDIAKSNPPVASLSNPILSYEFYLSLIYIFDQITRADVLSIANLLSTCSEDEINTSVETTINTFIREGKVYCTSGRLSTTQRGNLDLIFLKRTKKSTYQVGKFLTDMRFNVFNKLYRGKIGTRGEAY